MMCGLLRLRRGIELCHEEITSVGSHQSDVENVYSIQASKTELRPTMRIQAIIGEDLCSKVSSIEQRCEFPKREIQRLEHMC